MWPDRVSNPGPLTYESGALPTALRGPASELVPTCQIYYHGISEFVLHWVQFIDACNFDRAVRAYSEQLTHAYFFQIFALIA